MAFTLPTIRINHKPAFVPFLPIVNQQYHKQSSRPVVYSLQIKVNPLEDDDNNDNEEEDVPDDWNGEDDILLSLNGLEDMSDIVLEDDDDDDVVLEEEDEDGTVMKRSNDDEEEEDEYELELVLEEEEEEEEDEEEKEIVEEYAIDESVWEEDEEYVEITAGSVDWVDDEDGDDDDDDSMEWNEDPEDPQFAAQKELIDQAIAASIQRAHDESFEPIEFIVDENQLTPEQEELLEQSPLQKQIQAMMKNMELTEQDVEAIGDLEEAVAATPDLMRDDPYPAAASPDYVRPPGVTDDLLRDYDATYKRMEQVIDEEPWDKVVLREWQGYEGLSNETLSEMEDCLEEMGGSAYNVTRWLLYDLNFNVSNLILAAVKHNREAPVLFQHWYPQLVTYKRYQHARDRNFDFNWHDVEQADLGELERYYQGFGYDEIPTKAPAETGIIRLEDLDEEEIKMAAFESWMTDVYNPEWDRKDFDDDDFQDEDNVFSEFYEPPQHPDLPTFEEAMEDLEVWKEQLGEHADDPAMAAYRDRMGQSFNYKVVRDEEFEREFRGHMIIACTAAEYDLDVAEQITLRFDKEFGKQVFVETRVLALAREEDNVYEIWLESYDIELLHSKKRALSNFKDWTGPAEVDAAQIDYLVDRVRYLISDDSRYSYRMEMEYAE
ncbi:hypothetical protein FisN_8Lh024 [Fistulifera solaris]|uniref:Uncharacterized protein n=1 Tax=Fistulifera solaris TaxID=1519565 RepID=A0A1Z5JDT0_FISSO|nr:hypothetical protein FisN_8Lh024 [Fistulifera solaris]|eukprot:GAX11938.1 hypothetical protein FisN_8Lh024 [Fistulifera solaris]